jgi:hypothetical protein
MAISPATLSAITTGASSLTGLFTGIASGYAQKASGFLQQAGYAAQASSNLYLAGLRADKEIEYANIQFRRKQFQTQMDQINYKIAANSLLQDLRRTNAAVRARAAANGVAIGEGSAMGVQTQNVLDTYRDVGLVDLSALAARVFGMEDATNILKAGYDSAFYEREAAISNAKALLRGGSASAKQGGLLGNISMIESGVKFAQTFPFQAFGGGGGSSGVNQQTGLPLYG